jgi:hypothetical protein
VTLPEKGLIPNELWCIAFCCARMLIYDGEYCIRELSYSREEQEQKERSKARFCCFSSRLYHESLGGEEYGNGERQAVK